MESTRTSWSKSAQSVVRVVYRGGRWPKVWDLALHLGSRHTISLQRLMGYHGRGQHPCSLCDLKDPIIGTFVRNAYFCIHYVLHHRVSYISHVIPDCVLQKNMFCSEVCLY